MNICNAYCGRFSRALWPLLSSNVAVTVMYTNSQGHDSGTNQAVPDQSDSPILSTLNLLFNGKLY